MHEINAIAETLREQRLGAVEATALLHRVMEEVDVAIFALDDEERLRLVNRAGERLLAEPAERLLGQAAEDLGLAELLEGETRAHRSPRPSRAVPAAGRSGAASSASRGRPTSCW